MVLSGMPPDPLINFFIALIAGWSFWSSIQVGLVHRDEDLKLTSSNIKDTIHGLHESLEEMRR